MNRQKKSAKSKLICLCNSVPQDEIEKAIAGGCRTLDRIFDVTQAGVGPCGGSCRPQLAAMLEEYLKTGRFPKPTKS